MDDAAARHFRSSTLGWLRGTLAGWGTIVLPLGGIVLDLGAGPMAASGRLGPLLLALLVARRSCWSSGCRISPPTTRSPRSG